MIFFAVFVGDFSEANLKVARTLALTVSVIFELFQVFVSRTPENKSVWITNPFTNLYLVIAVGTAFILHLFIVYVKPIANIFGLVPITVGQWIAMFLVVIIGIIILDMVKIGQNKILNKN